MADDYESLRDAALAEIKQYMDSIDQDRGKKLAYWIKDYAKFLTQEQTFQPQKLIRYKRGSIVKVHFGYRIGAEEGGLHYAVVMDQNNSIHSPTLTVIPLTSVKPDTDLSNLHSSKVLIGNEVYTLLTSKYNTELCSAKQHMQEIRELINKFNTSDDPSPLLARLDEVECEIAHCNKMKRAVAKMKQGSIALVGQITTISKLRIYDPKFHNDALSKIRVSPATLDLLDAKVQELYGPPTKKVENG